MLTVLTICSNLRIRINLVSRQIPRQREDARPQGHIAPSYRSKGVGVRHRKQRDRHVPERARSRHAYQTRLTVVVTGGPGSSGLSLS